MYFTVCTEHVVDINKGARRVLESIEMEVGVNNSTELFFKRHLCTKPVYEVCIVLYNTCMGFPYILGTMEDQGETGQMVSLPSSTSAMRSDIQTPRRRARSWVGDP